MEKNNKIPEIEENAKKDNLKKLKTEILEEYAKNELYKLWYWFIKKADWIYLLTKEWSVNIPNMKNYSETLLIEIFNVENLVKLAELIEKKLEKLKGDLNPYLDSGFITKGIYYRSSVAPKDIYNKDTLLSIDMANPDSTIISFSEIASILWVSTENQEKSKEYINGAAEKIMEFLIAIKVDEKAKK
jgi:hypothetical protein